MLAVCVPVVGVPSETFIRRHVERLAPGATVVIARRRAPDAQRTWDVDVPVLYLDDLVDAWGGEREREAVAGFLSDHGVRAILAEYLDVWLPFAGVFTASGARTAVHGHGYDISSRLDDPWWREEYLAWRAADTVVVMSEAARARLAAIGLDRLAVVPYGVDLPEGVARPSPDGEVHVLAVGRCVAKKAPLTTLEAFARAAAAVPALRLTYVGDGPLLGEMRDRAASLRVELPGALANEQVLERFARADVFCQHSVRDPETGDEEGLPVAILEAMAHGLPVVATRHAGIPEAVVEGETGFLVEEHDVTAMADHLARLGRDPGLRQAMGAAGRERAESRFIWEAERAGLASLLGL